MKPDNFIKVETAIRNAFNTAAEKSTGDAKLKFERLRDANAAFRNGQSYEEALATLTEYGEAMNDVERLIKTDKAAAQIWVDCNKAIQKAKRKYHTAGASPHQNR